MTSCQAHTPTQLGIMMPGTWAPWGGVLSRSLWVTLPSVGVSAQPLLRWGAVLLLLRTQGLQMLGGLLLQWGLCCLLAC